MNRNPNFPMRKLVLVLCTLTAVLLPGAASAQNLQRIVAVVNDDAISLYDLAMRTRLVIASSGLPDTPETRNRVAPQVLRTLIDEKLQLQEAKRLNITVSEEEIEAALENIARQNRMRREDLSAFIKRIGVPASTLIEQTRAAVAWNKVVNQQIRPTIQVGDEEVNERLDQIRANIGQEETLLSEIFLAVDTPEQEEDVRSVAERLVEQIRQGADFGALARQFSQSATAAVNGDLGWVQKGQLGPELDAAIENLKPGAVSDPIRTAAGFHIIAMRDRRIASLPGAEESEVTIEQMYFPARAESDRSKVEDLARKAVEAGASLKACGDVSALREKFPEARRLLPAKFKLKDLSATLRSEIENLPVGKLSSPIELPTGVLLVMVCDVKSAARMPDRREIRRRIILERLNLLTRRQLRDIRRAAFVDIRI